MVVLGAPKEQKLETLTKCATLDDVQNEGVYPVTCRGAGTHVYLFGKDAKANLVLPEVQESQRCR